ncbi:MAG: diguanylate cyclase [Burkholderiaceae bacterium]|nr:diguanylate cyclase [Burkholderiaceae bacterium]
MTEPDLFGVETATLELARQVLAQELLDATAYRSALADLTKDYDRLLREMRRLIRRSDRAERYMNELNAKLHHLTEQLDHKAKHDALTGVFNRGAIFERARNHLQNGPLSVILLDIDLFKSINDQFGHPAGDSVLQELSGRLVGSLGGVGEVGRVGGEEFIILLSARSLADAVVSAEKLRQAVAGRPFAILPQRQVTASFGVSRSEAAGRFEDAYARADQALYEAKRQGRNCVVHAGA